MSGAGEKEQYVIEREFLGIMSIKEFIGTIIRSHNIGSLYECEQINCMSIKTVENALYL